MIAFIEKIFIANVSLFWGVFLNAFVVSLPVLWLVRKLAHRIGLLDYPSQRKAHTRVVPRGGGIGIFAGLMIAYAIGYALAHYFPSFFPLRSQIFQAQPFKEMVVILLGAGAIFATGLLDDLYDLKPVTKIVCETVVVFFLFYHGVRITLFVQNEVLSFFLTWGWILFITNAFNLLDNMDGLSAGVAFISGGIFLVVAAQTHQWDVAFMLIGLLGSLLAFLCFNFPPASLFMGDCGSLLIGYMMAVLTVQATFYQVSFPAHSIVLPVLVLVIPIFDTVTVSIIRLKSHTPLFKADKRHFSHRLVNLGLSPRHAVLVIYLITFSTGLSALLLYQIDIFGTILVVTQILSILFVIHLLEQVANSHNHDHEI